MGYCIYIRIPPVQDLPFLLTPEDWLKLQSARKTKKNMGLPLKNWVIPLKNMGLPLTNFVKFPKEFICFTPKEFHIFYSTLKEIVNFYNLPLENSMVPQPAGCGY